MSHRRWFQFSLRTLFIAMFEAATWPAHYANRFYRQRKAIEAIERKGGEVRAQADGTIDYVFLPYVTAEDVKRLCHLSPGPQFDGHVRLVRFVNDAA